MKQIQLNIEEAKSYLENYKYDNEVYEAIQVLLNELDKKDKTIDMMAEWLYNDDSSFGLFGLREVNTPEKIKEYFYNKIGGEK